MACLAGARVGFGPILYFGNKATVYSGMSPIYQKQAHLAFFFFNVRTTHTQAPSAAHGASRLDYTLLVLVEIICTAFCLIIDTNMFIDDLHS